MSKERNDQPLQWGIPHIVKVKCFYVYGAIKSTFTYLTLHSPGSWHSPLLPYSLAVDCSPSFSHAMQDYGFCIGFADVRGPAKKRIDCGDQPREERIRWVKEF